MLKLAWRRPATMAPSSAPTEVIADLVADHLATHGELHWRARGRSMQPAISDDAVVHLRPAYEVRPGDVVLAHVRINHQLVLHRVRAMTGDEIELRGDACRLPDPPVRRTDVLAVADPRPPESALSLAYRWLP